MSRRSIETDEYAEDRTQTANKDKRENGEPAAADQDAQLSPFRKAEWIIWIARGNGDSSDLTSGVDKLEITIRGL